MARVKGNTVLMQRNGETVKDENGKELTLRALVGNVLDFPPHVFQNRGNDGDPKQKADLRGEIIDLFDNEDEPFLDPKQVQEILFCLSVTQPPSIVRQCSKIFSGFIPKSNGASESEENTESKTPAPENKENVETASA